MDDDWVDKVMNGCAVVIFAALTSTVVVLCVILCIYMVAHYYG